MRKLGHGGSDSLELLLDTVCSMFGAILLIAILVALMAKTTSVESESDQASVEIVQRRIDIAQKDLAQILQLKAAIDLPSAPVEGNLLEEKIKLELAIRAARAARASKDAETQDKIKQMTSDPGAQIRDLNNLLTLQQREIVALSNQIAALDDQITRTQERISAINKLIQTSRDSREIALRFPKESETTKKPFHIICKYGKLYPTRNASGVRNEDSIKWTRMGDDKDLSEPIKNRGLQSKIQSSEIKALMHELPRNQMYVVFYVYDDSFEAFQFAREIAVRTKLEHGLTFLQTSKPLVWGSKGSTPPPQ